MALALCVGGFLSKPMDSSAQLYCRGSRLLLPLTALSTFLALKTALPEHAHRLLSSYIEFTVLPNSDVWTADVAEAEVTACDSAGGDGFVSGGGSL